MGMSKPKLILSLIFETVAFVIIVILTGIAVGFIISGFFVNFGGDSISEVKYDSYDNIFVNINVSVKILLAGIGLSVISSLFSIIFIIRYQPMKILRSRY